MTDGTDMVAGQIPDAERGPYEMARLQAAELLEEACGEKLPALGLLARLEKALWAAALLQQPNAELAREAFGAGLTAFNLDLPSQGSRRTRPR